MTKNITIQEGGTAKPMSNVAKIRTDMQGGGTCYWVPEDETHLTTKHITENGTYEAVDDDAYGYSKVTVNVPGGKDGPPGGSGSSISWNDPTTGNDYVSTVNEDGTKTDTKVPSSIRVVTPPTKTHYNEGDTIVYDGIVVKAYDGEGNEMQTVPFTELDFPESVAPAPEDITVAGTFDDLVPYEPIPVVDRVAGKRDGSDFEYLKSDWSAGMVAYTFDDWGRSNRLETLDATGNYDEESGRPSFTYGGKTVYYRGHLYLNYHSVSTPYLDHPRGISDAHLAWVIVYGERMSGDTAIPVNWPKAPGGKTLSDSFEITVETASGSGDSEFGGSEGGTF